MQKNGLNLWSFDFKITPSFNADVMVTFLKQTFYDVPGVWQTFFAYHQDDAFSLMKCIADCMTSVQWADNDIGLGRPTWFELLCKIDPSNLEAQVRF